MSDLLSLLRASGDALFLFEALFIISSFISLSSLSFYSISLIYEFVILDIFLRERDLAYLALSTYSAERGV